MSDDIKQKQLESLKRERLKKEKPDLIFLNCFGFPPELKQKVQETTGKPTIHSSSVIARVLKELV